MRKDPRFIVLHSSSLYNILTVISNLFFKKRQKISIVPQKEFRGLFELNKNYCEKKNEM